MCSDFNIIPHLIKRISKYVLFLLITLIFFPNTGKSQGAFPLQVSIRLLQPYPTHLSDFTDYEHQVYVDIFNSSAQTYDIILYGTLTREDHLVTIQTNNSNLPSNCIHIVPGMNNLGISDMMDLFNPEYLTFEGVESRRIVMDEAIPEGYYTLCLRALDCNRPEIALSGDPTDLSGCFSWYSTLQDPPELIQPVCDEYVDSSSPNINILWTLPSPGVGMGSLEYTIKIVELDPDTRDPNDAVLSAPNLTPALTGITSLNHSLRIPDEVILEEGRSYAIQIIATDTRGDIEFKNGGRSEPCVFHYGVPGITIGQPQWDTPQGTTFESLHDLEFLYHVPMPESTEEELSFDMFAFEIPEGVSPEEAYERRDFIYTTNEQHLINNEDAPYSYAPSTTSGFVFGHRYGIIMNISDPESGDDMHFENGGKSEILAFNYGTPTVIHKPEWLTANNTTFPGEEDIAFDYRIPLPEATEMELNVDYYIFEIPEGVDPDEAFNRRSFAYTFNRTGQILDNSPSSFVPAGFTGIEFGHRYGVIIKISDPARSDDIRMENDGKSDVLTFSVTGAATPTDVVLTYPRDGDRIPFSFFPLVARYQPFNTEYQHWQSTVVLSKNGSPDDSYTIPEGGLRWPGGSYEGQRVLAGLSEITEDESQNIAVYKNNSQRDEPFERGANYRWETNVKLYYDVAGAGPYLEFNKSSTFSRGMGPSQLEQPGWGAIIAPDSAFNFKWITAEAPEKVLPIRINHARMNYIAYFNGIVDEKWVLEVSRSEAFDSVIFHEEGRIGNGTDYLVSDITEEEIRNELYKELTSTESFTPADTGYYYWRVKWLKDPEGDYESDDYESSQIRPFWVGHAPPPTVASGTTTPPEGCVSTCLAPEITDTAPATAPAVGSTISVGFFTMNVTEITSSSGDRFSGSGEIRVPFLNNVRVRVSFTNIQANAAHQLIDGEVVADDDIPSIAMDSTAVTIGGHRVPIPSMSDEESDALNSAISSTERMVSFISDARPMGMPLGLDNEIDGFSYLIGITEMHFEKRKAWLTAVARLDIPEFSSYIPALGIKGQCFTPNGLGDEGRLYLLRDHTLTPPESDIQFSFSGAEDGDTTRATYVEWDCRGFKCMAIRGKVEFPTDWMVKEDEDGNVIDGERVSGTFGVKTCRGNQWIAEIGIDPFQVKGMKGWGFSPVHAYLDFSDIDNPPGLTFPALYDTRALEGPGGTTSTSESNPEGGETPSSDSDDVSSGLRNTWRGFYLSDLSVHAPPDFEDDVTGRASFGIHNMIIDNSGITVSVFGANIIDYEDGSIDNLSFSLDSVRIDIVQTSTISGGIKGKLGLPIFEESDHLGYAGLIVYSADTFAINVHVDVDDTLNVPMWQCKMFLAPDSEIGFNHSSGSGGENTHVYADLTGGVDIAGDLASATESIQLNFKGIRFEGLEFNSDGPTFDIDSFYVAYASPQKSMSGFPVNINNINFDVGGGIGSSIEPGLTFDLSLTLSDAGFSAAAGFRVYGQLNISDGRERFEFGGVDLNRIEIHQEISAIRLDGEMEFYNGDETYGDGLRGHLEVTLPMDISGQLTVQFGTKKTRGVINPAFNTRDYYSYFYVDGLIRWPTPVIIFGNFGLYGVGGGVYYHMSRNESGITPTGNLLPDSESGGSESSGVVYTPNFDSAFGLKVVAVLGTNPENAFNMDVTIEMAFTSDGGLGLFAIDGDGFVMASFSERPNAKITAHVHFEYSLTGDGSERVEGDFEIRVDYGDILHGAGDNKEFVHAEFLSQDDIWHYYMGTPESPGGLKADLHIVTAELTSYLMMGYGIPNTLPPLPPAISSLLYGAGQSALNGGGINPSTVASRERSDGEMTKMRTAKGFAFGAAFGFHAEFDFAIFYAGLDTNFGFDFLVNQDSARICAETGEHPGINDWYSTGRMYAGLAGEMGVQVDLFFIQGKFPFINLAAAISLSGGLPNPAWAEGRAGLYYSVLDGAVEGQCNFKVQFGQKCSSVSENPLSDIEFIGDILPDYSPGDEGVSVFTVPAVSFNLPVNKFLEVPAGLDDEPDKVRVFWPFLDRFKLYDQDNHNAETRGSFELNDTHTIATFAPANSDPLESTHNYKVEVAVKAYEYFENGTHRLIMESGHVWEEPKQSTFKTGLRPPTIDEDNVAYTYPLPNQAYFLQNERIDGRCFIKYKMSNQNYLFNSTIEDREYDYVARIKPVSGGNALEVPIEFNDDGIYFNIPRLDNEEYYALQIVRKPHRSMADQLTAQIGPMYSPSVLRPITRTFDISTVTVNLQSTELPAEIVRAGETLLYSYYFRTSRYNTLSQKLTDLSLNATYMSSLIETFKVEGAIPELFEEYDIRGYYKNGSKVLEPLISFIAPYTYTYHRTKLAPKIYDLREELITARNSDPGLRGMPVTNLNSHRKGCPPTNTIDFATSNNIDYPLQDWEIEREAGIHESPTASTTSTGTSSTGTGSGSIFAAGPSVTSTNPGTVSLLNGSGTNIFATPSFSISAPIGESHPSYDLELYYSTSIYARLDASELKRSLSAILAYRDPVRGYVYANRLLSNYPALYGKIFSTLITPMSFYNYTRGTYGIQFTYSAPRLTGIRSRIDNQARSGSTLKTFTY